MRNKRLLRTLSAICLTLGLALGFTVPAFAQGAAPPPAEDTTNDSNVVVEETEKAPPLTPEGNAALVDDFGGNKQLITVTTKAGNIMLEAGAKSVRAIASHCVMSDPASFRVQESALTEMVFTDSIPYSKKCDKVKQLSIADMFAETIKRVMNNESISSQYII